MTISSLPPGGAYQDLKPCITINLLRFSLLPQKNAHSMWSIYNAETGDRLNKDFVFYFLEILKYTKLPKKPIHEMTKMERWGKLMSLLLKEKRYDDATKATEDAEFREKLFKEYRI